MWIERKILYGVALGVLCSIALAFDHPPAEGGRNEPVELFFSESEATACHSHHQTFFLEELRDLYICAIWRGLAGTYVEHLTLILPDGYIYQILTVPFTTPGLPGPAEVEVAGRHHTVKKAWKAGEGETAVMAVLPVAGTFITEHNLVGRWTVKVALDEQLIGQEHVTFKKRK